MPLPRKLPSKAKPKRSKAKTWVCLERQLEGLEGTWCDGEILNYPAWKTIKYRETAHDIIVLAELTTAVAGPCACGEPSTEFKRWGFTETHHVSDLPIRKKRVRIYCKLQRLRCAGCGATAQQPAPGVDERHALTARLIEYVRQESLSIFRSFSDLSDETGVSHPLIRNLFTDYAERLERNRRIETPKWLAIDEVYPRKDTEYCVISHPPSRQVLDLLPNNSPQALAKWLLQLPDRHSVQVVTVDMWPPYRSVVRRLLPDARIVVDRYHVHNLLNVALKQVLEVVRDSMTYSEHREHMRPERLLLKSYRRLSEDREVDENNIELPSEIELVDKWLEDVPDLARAHQLKEDLSDILHLPDRQKAEELIDLWLDQVVEFVKYFRAKYEKGYRGKWTDPFGNVPGTISDWRSNILNYIDFKHVFGMKPTNAFAEFCNKQIKKAYKVGNGGFSFEVLRIKVVYGGVMIKRRPPHPLDEKRPRAKRDPATLKNSKKRFWKNPKANVARLERAREEKDETKNLLSDPRENQAWLARFNTTRQAKLDLDQHEPAQNAAAALPVTQAVKEQPSQPLAARRRRTPKHSHKQIKMF